jgi:hypothetical protein
MTSLSKPWAVDLWESERGWGGRVDDTMFFETKELADAFVLEYNTRFNSLDAVPDWYMVAMPPRYLSHAE